MNQIDAKDIALLHAILSEAAASASETLARMHIDDRQHYTDDEREEQIAYVEAMRRLIPRITLLPAAPANLEDSPGANQGDGADSDHHALARGADDPVPERHEDRPHDRAPDSPGRLADRGAAAHQDDQDQDE